MSEATLNKSTQEMSASIAKLASALSKAQSKMKPAVKDSQNPFFKSKYADLSSVWDSIREPLSANELAVIQTTESDSENVRLVTLLVHSSGEWIRGVLNMKPAKQDPQGIGSCLTYARRYALASMVGVCPEDDDGNAASSKPQGVSDQKKVVTLTKEQIFIISDMLEKAKITEKEFCLAAKIESIESMPESKFEAAKAAIKRLESAKPKEMVA